MCGGVDCVETIFGGIGIGCGYVVFNLLYLLSEYLGKSGHLHSYLGYLDVYIL